MAIPSSLSLAEHRLALARQRIGTRPAKQHACRRQLGDLQQQAPHPLGVAGVGDADLEHHAGHRVGERPVDEALGDESLVRHHHFLVVPVQHRGGAGADARHGALDLALELPDDELAAILLSLPGVGPYAAANLLLILGRGDFIPVDSWALKLVSHEWYDGPPVTPRQVEEAFEAWGEFKGLAFWFWDWKYQG